jgi:Holliday junction resolvase
MQKVKQSTIQAPMANPNGRKGAQFETDVMKFLRSVGLLAERLTKAGAKDEGDLVCIVAGKTYILELKNRKSVNLPEFWAEAEVEALNYAKARGIGEVPLHYVVVKRRNSGIDKAWVIQDLAQWIKEKDMPVPQGIISTTTGPVDPSAPKIEEAIKAADAEVATEEYVAEKPAPKKRAKKV